MPRFSDETEHTFDCAVECCELTADVPMFFRCFYPGDAVVEHLNVPSPNEILSRAEGGEGVTGYITRKITERADELLQRREFPTLVWHQILLQSLTTLAMQGREMSIMMAHDIAMGITQWGDIFPQKKAIRRSHSPKFQRKFIRNHGMFRMFNDRARRLNKLIKAETRKYGLHAIFDGDVVGFEELNQLERAYRRMPVPGRMARTTPPPSKENRQMLKRAMKLATAIVGEHAVYDFMRGTPVYVFGKDFVFKAEMRNPFTTGHGSTSIQVCDHDLEPIADMCVYFQNVPALDHLAALKMHCDAGQEADIVYDGNVTRTYARAKDHAAFLAVRDLKKRDSELNSRLNIVDAMHNVRPPVETEAEVVNFDVAGTAVEVERPRGFLVQTAPEETVARFHTDPQIRLWVNSPSVTITGMPISATTWVSATTRTNRITNGISSVAYVTGSSGTNTANFTITSNSTASNTIAWVMPQLTAEQAQEQRKNNSRYMRFRRNDRPVRDRTINYKKKQKYMDRSMRLFVGMGKNARITDNLVFERWSEAYAKNEGLRADLMKIVFEEITGSPKLARVLMGLAESQVRDRQRLWEEQQEVARPRREQLMDMLRDDDGNLPPNADEILANAHVDTVANFAPYEVDDDEPLENPNFEEARPEPHHIRVHTARLTVAATSRMLDRMREEHADGTNPFAPMDEGNEAAARDIANRLLGNTFETMTV